MQQPPSFLPKTAPAKALQEEAALSTSLTPHSQEENQDLSQQPLAKALQLANSQTHQNRFTVGLAVGFFFIGSVALGGWVWSGVVLLTMVLCFQELRGLLAVKQSLASRTLFYLTTIALVALATLQKTSVFTPVLTVAMMGLVFSSLFSRPRRSMADIGASLFSIFYISFMLMHFILLRGLPTLTANETLHEIVVPAALTPWFYQQQGFWLVVWVIVVVAFADIGGYYMGKLFGKRLLYPELSPKKTREGALGSLLSSIGIGLLLAPLARLQASDAFILSTLLAVVGGLGDLVESHIKREAGAKDSGQLLQTHGGILDRLDSYIFSGTVAYYYIHWFVRKQGLAEFLASTLPSTLAASKATFLSAHSLCTSLFTG